MKMFKLTALATASLLLLGSCANTEELEQRVDALEKKVESLSANKLINNPATANTPEAQPDVKPEGPLPAMSFEESEFDFGDINQGDVVEHTFKFTNTGDAPLIIENASASCGCTVPQHTKESIPPGGTGEIVVRFDSKGKSGQQSPVITVVANTSPKQTRLNLRGFVQTS